MVIRSLRNVYGPDPRYDFVPRLPRSTVTHTVRLLHGIVTVTLRMPTPHTAFAPTPYTTTPDCASCYLLPTTFYRYAFVDCRLDLRYLVWCYTPAPPLPPITSIPHYCSPTLLHSVITLICSPLHTIRYIDLSFTVVVVVTYVVVRYLTFTYFTDSLVVISFLIRYVTLTDSHHDC